MNARKTPSLTETLLHPELRGPDAEETVRAIYQGAVDAIVVHGTAGPQIVTLTGTDEPYRVLVEHMSDGALTVGPDGMILYVNARLMEMTGAGADEMVGRPFASLFTGEMPAHYRNWTPPQVSGVRQEANLARGGDPLPVSVWTSPIALGEVPATLVTVSDLSVQRRAEEIAAAERFARSILEQATDAIVVLDPHGRITHASWAAEQLAGEKPIGRAFSQVFAMEAADRSQTGVLERSSANIDSILATRPFHGTEVRLRSPKANGRTFLLSAGPLVDQSKRPVGSIVTLTDITARKRAEDQQTILVAELNHRVKNILAIVQSLAAQTVRKASSLPAFQENFGGRLRALSVAHDVLTKTRWGGAELTQLLSEILGPYRERVKFAGPAVMLSSQCVVPLSLTLHELMTNAAKYGALCGTGSVELSWDVSENGVGQTVRLTWAERGGPPVTQDTQRGFGTMLIERVVRYDLEGHAELDYRPEGVRCTLQFPISVPRTTLEEQVAFAQTLA